MLLGRLIVFSKNDIGDFIALSNNRVDDHSFLCTCFCDADGHLIHISAIGVLSFGLLFILLVFFVLVEVGGGFDIGEQTNGVFSSSFG